MTEGPAEPVDLLKCLNCDQTGTILSFPCDSQHQYCRTCIEENTFMDSAIRCPVCRRIFLINVDYLEVHQGDIPKCQQCAVCSQSGMKTVAHHYCTVCTDALCENCLKQFHNPYFTGNRTHDVISIHDLRLRYDIHSSRYCKKLHHDRCMIQFACTQCKELGCHKCDLESGGCANEGDHVYIPLAEPAEQMRLKMREVRDQLKDRLSFLDEKVKWSSESHHNMAKELRDIENSIEVFYGEKLALLEKGKQKLIEEIDDKIKGSTFEVLEFKRKSESTKELMQLLIDNTQAVLNNNDAIQILNYERKLKDRANELVALSCNAPVGSSWVYEKYDENGLNPLGILQQKPLIVNAMKHEKELVTWGPCYTGIITKSGILHAGRGYRSFINQPTEGNVHCMREDRNGDIYCLVSEPRTKTAHIVVYTTTQNGDYKEDHRFSVDYFSKLTHIAIIDQFLIRAGADKKCLYTYNKIDGSLLGTVTHPQMQHLWGVCVTDDEDVIITDWKTGKVFKYNLKDPYNVTVFCSDLIEPAGVVYCYPHVFIISNEKRRIYQFNKSGTLLATHEAAELWSDTHDIHMKNNKVVISNRDHGAHVFQIQ